MSEENKQDYIPNDPDTGHEYDGIREFDNHLPNWWLITLFVTVFFGYGYWFYYHELNGPGSRAEYALEVEEANAAALARAKERGGVTDEALVAMTGVAMQVAAGQATFKQMCASCHGDNAQGLVGPNLTDKFWLHGARPTQILQTVSAGITQKGMPAWGQVLGTEKVESVVAYVLTIKNKNVPGKEPQGEPSE